MSIEEKHEPSLQRLIEEDAVGQLRRCEGLMANLGSEDDVPKLDWVEGVSRLLADDTKLEEVEKEARAIWERGIRHILWAGMGGSVITIHVLSELGFCNSQNGERMAIYPLDSTDPAAINAIIRRIARAKNIGLPTKGEQQGPGLLGELLNDVMMVGVAMGMTSEEPITHLTWFAELIEHAKLQPADHLLVMALPGSYLDTFAHEHQVPSLPLQLDGRTGTGGRMSAPTTRVFLLPAALYLTRLSPNPGQLRALLQTAWREYDLDLATERPAEHLFVQLAAALSNASIDGVCRLLLRMPDGWKPLVPWIEQLMEESLGKEGKGVIVFEEQPLNPQAPYYRTSGTLHVRVQKNTLELSEDNVFTLTQAYLANGEAPERLAALAASFLGWQLCMALYGYLHDIPFAGQPAVENYKARARILRTQDDPLQSVISGDVATGGMLTLVGAGVQETPVAVFVSKLREVVAIQSRQVRSGLSPRLDYLDLTINGELAIRAWQGGVASQSPQGRVAERERLDKNAERQRPGQELPASWMPGLNIYGLRIANHLLGVPVKLRRAPAAYHSTEQSEMDGSPYFMSLRLLEREHEEILLGTYSDTFLRAQAVSTWQAMVEKGRHCCLLIINASGVEAVITLEQFFNEVARYLEKGNEL